jgi:hypothetical protein
MRIIKSQKGVNNIISPIPCREYNCDNAFSVAIRNQLFKNRLGVELTMPSIRIRKFKERPKKNELPYFDAHMPATLNKRLVMSMEYYMRKRQIIFERKSTLAPCAPLAPMLTLPPSSCILPGAKSVDGGRDADEESISPSVTAM